VHRTDSGSSPDRLTDLLEELEPDLHAIAARFRLPAGEFDEVYQDTALAFLSRRGPIRSPRQWILAVFRNRCLLYWRTRRRRFIEAVDASLLAELGGCHDPRPQRDLRHDLRGALAGLPARCRALLGLRYGLEQSSPQVAARQGARAAAVRQATRRCLSALSRCLVATGFLEGPP
jgi:RNA polymerase sigma factor (sigma-70 family)